ncbi:hypothetical protein [Mycobacterium montefiorense]|uniref:hypothetical protein n=1 Tax=Mycobacterium montefiorense TaxID=154654 RepID=UPI0021DBEE65|nr:hypothetical protein [Mycobacterium montefiorense]MCV7428463.1 hypothetical protein [Mycobacterium montefiorense]GLE54618.1 hypothetical protein ATCCBAA256_42170 [Mycobacterium montefiorense]
MSNGTDWRATTFYAPGLDAALALLFGSRCDRYADRNLDRWDFMAHDDRMIAFEAGRLTGPITGQPAAAADHEPAVQQAHSR